MMISNCLVVAVAFRLTHNRSRIRATWRVRGPRGVSPHFYCILDTGYRVEFRSIKRPLKPVKQVIFVGRVVWTKER